MKMIKLLKPFLLSLAFLSLNTISIQAQTEEVKTTSDVVKSMSDVLESFDELKESKEVTEVLKKFGKAARSFALAGAALDIGLALFGGDDENTALLKEIKNMLTKVQSELKNVRTDIKDGVKDIKDQGKFFSAQSQVFESLSNIENCLGKVNTLMNCGNDPLCQKVAGDEILILQSQMAALGADIINIRRSVLGEMRDASSNLLEGAIAYSHGDLALLKKMGKRLLGAALGAAYCQNMFYSIKYKDAPNEVAIHRKNVFTQFGDDIEIIQNSIDAAVVRCDNFNTIKQYAKSGVNQAVIDYEGITDRQQICEKMFENLRTKWPKAIVIVVATQKPFGHRFYNNFNDYKIPTIEVVWETERFNGYALVISKPEFINMGYRYDSYITDHYEKISGKEEMQEAVRIYKDYWLQQNLHNYNSDGGSYKPFTSMPYVHIGQVVGTGSAKTASEVKAGFTHSRYFNGRWDHTTSGGWHYITSMFFPSSSSAEFRY